MALELEGIEGLTEDQIKLITEAHNKDVLGLKKNNTDLIEEKQNAKSLYESEQQKAIEAAEEAKIEKAKGDKNMDGLVAALAEKDERIASQKVEFEQADRKRIIDAASNEFINKHVVRDDPAAAAYMSAEYRKGLDVRDGALVNINETGITGVSIENYSSSVVGNDTYSKYILGTQSNGGGASGGSNGAGGAGTKKLSEMTKTEQSILANTNPDQYKQLATAGE